MVNIFMLYFTFLTSQNFQVGNTELKDLSGLLFLFARVRSQSALLIMWPSVPTTQPDVTLATRSALPRHNSPWPGFINLPVSLAGANTATTSLHRRSKGEGLLLSFHLLSPPLISFPQPSSPLPSTPDCPLKLAAIIKTLAGASTGFNLLIWAAAWGRTAKRLPGRTSIVSLVLPRSICSPPSPVQSSPVWPGLADLAQLSFLNTCTTLFKQWLKSITSRFQSVRLSVCTNLLLNLNPLNRFSFPPRLCCAFPCRSGKPRRRRNQIVC